MRFRAAVKQTDFAQVSEINALRDMVGAKLLEMGRTLEIRRKAGLESAIQSVIAGDEKSNLERVRKFIGDVQADDLRRQDERSREAKAKAAFHQNLTIGLVALDALFLGAIGLLGRKINRLQHLVTVCAWSQKVQHEGKWMRFEEFLQKQFGLRCLPWDFRGGVCQVHPTGAANNQCRGIERGIRGVKLTCLYLFRSTSAGRSRSM